MPNLTQKYIEISKTKGEFDPRKALIVLKDLKKDFKQKSKLGETLKEFVGYIERSLEAKSLKIYAPDNLKKEEINVIKEKIEKSLNRVFLNVETFVDPKLLGGVRVAAGDMVFDMTILAKLQTIQEKYTS